MLVAFPLVFELSFVGLLSYLFYKSHEEVEKQARSKQIVSTANSVERLYFDCGMLLFMYSFTKDDAIIERCGKNIDSIKKQVQELKALVARNKILAKKFELVEKSNRESLVVLIDTKESLELGGLKLGAVRGIEKRQKLQEVTKEGMHIISDFVQEANRLQKYDPRAAKLIERQISLLLVFGLAFSILMALAIAYFFTSDINKRLLSISENTKSLSEGRALNDPVSGSDEIKELDIVFRQMAGELSRAREELLLSQERMKEILDTAPQGLLLVDENAAISFANKSAAMMLAFPDSKGELKELKLSTQTAELNLSDVLDKIENKATEFRLKRFDGSEFPAMLLGRPFLFAEQKLLLVAISDLTEEKKIQEMKAQFVAMLTHDLRSPLSSLKLFLSSLELDLKGSAAAGDILGRIDSSKKGLTRLLGLINDLLDLDKLEEGKLELKKSRIFVNDLISESLDLHKSSYEAKSLQLEIDDSDCELQADFDKLLRALSNLISNAIKFAPPGSKLQVKVVESPSEIELHVIDQGPGISAEAQRFIFDRFYQASENGESQQGSGLGLAIARAIVEAHSGRIALNSESTEGGSDFYFVLPKQADAENWISEL